MTANVLTTIADGVATVTLNRPQSSNALTRDLRDDLQSVLGCLAKESSVGAVVLTGAGERAFCAGLDRNELPTVLARLNDDDAPLEEDIAAMVSNHPAPVIAAVNGVVMTGGLELMLACDFAIAADHARFADTHARLGIAAMWGLTVRLPRRIGAARARQMSLTGEWVGAAQAAAWGLVNEVVPAGELMPRAVTLAAAIAGCDRDAVMFTRSLIDAGDEGGLVERLVQEKERASTFNRVRTQRSEGGLV